MLKIRLTRRGKKNSAFFRIVVAEHTAPIKGGFLEVLGFLNPHTKEKNFKTDRIQHWIEKGAQCSDTVHNLLVANGIVKGPKRAVRIKKKPIEPASAEATAAEGEKKVEASIEASIEKKPAEAKPEKGETEKPAGVKEEKKEVEAAKSETKEAEMPAKVAEPKEGKKEPEAVKSKPEKKEEQKKTSE